ncbi:MAG TPA: choice-of-anchor tandem repeat GloVer-containing protein, partial [Flavitalea sp.]|nr:choice-of-anchor tandem repeat GloVer-containing protein [Flavitalea sp.]
MRSKFYTQPGSLVRSFVLFLIKYKPKFVYRTLLVCLFFSSSAIAQDVLMGLASNGGPGGKGIAFSIKSTGTDFNIMEPFADYGRNPHSQLLLGPDGSYYGTTTNGGVYGYGSIYKMSPSGVITLIKSFNLGVDGGYPYGRLTLAKDGNLYGTTSAGGQYSAGVIYRLTMAGGFSVVKSLSGATDGSNPRGNLVAAKDGNLYGITYGGGTYGTGTIFRITTAGIYNVLKSLNKPTDGGQCYGSLMQASDGNFYGMAYGGGQYGYGTIFKYSLTTGFAVLRHVNAVADGSYTTGTLIEGKDTRLYGMMYSGGTYGNGTIFSISTAGSFTVLRHLRSGT